MVALHRQKKKGEESHDSRPVPHPGPSGGGGRSTATAPLPQLRPRRPGGEQGRPRAAASLPREELRTPGGAPHPGEGPAPAPAGAGHRLVALPHRRPRPAPPTAVRRENGRAAPRAPGRAEGRGGGEPAGGCGTGQEGLEQRPPAWRNGQLSPVKWCGEGGRCHVPAAASPPSLPAVGGWARVAAAGGRAFRWETWSSFTCREKGLRPFCEQVDKQSPAGPAAHRQEPQPSAPPGAHQRGACPLKTHPFALTVRVIRERSTFPKASGRRAEPAAPAVGEKRWGCSIYRGEGAGGREPGGRRGEKGGTAAEMGHLRGPCRRLQHTPTPRDVTHTHKKKTRGCSVWLALSTLRVPRVLLTQPGLGGRCSNCIKPSSRHTSRLKVRFINALNESL